MVNSDWSVNMDNLWVDMDGHLVNKKSQWVVNADWWVDMDGL